MGQSDIDFLGFVDTMPFATALHTLAHHAERLQHAYPVVTKVDLDVTAINDLGQFQRLVLSSDSLNLYGVDTLTLRCGYADAAAAKHGSCSSCDSGDT